MRNKLIRSIHWILVIISVLLIIGFAPVESACAETAAVKIGTIDYEDLTLQIFNNNNSVVYYSVDGVEWVEVEGGYDVSTKSYSMDISWVSSKTDATLYFKGSTVNDIVIVTLPMKDTEFDVTYDKAEGDFTFITTDDAEFFEWRKTTDYNWKRVSLEYGTVSNQAFLNTMEKFRLQGAKIIIRLPQITGTEDCSGSRPSKEVAITITARADAPLISVNSSRLTINTTSRLEYYDVNSSSWMECLNTMPLSEIAPEVLYEGGAKDAKLMIRKMATESAPYSETAYVTIEGQAAAPLIGDNSKDVSYYYLNSELVLTFNKAALTNAYEYTVVKPDNVLDIAKARWISVYSTSMITLSDRTAPDGSIIYVRKKGMDANTAKFISLVLSSAVSGFNVNY